MPTDRKGKLEFLLISTQYITITFYPAASPLYCNPSCCPPAPPLLQDNLKRTNPQ